MLEIRSIDVSYGDLQVIWDVSLNVNEGECVALIGANGAGKSTILKTISGLLKPKKGEISFNNQPVHTVPPHRLIEYGIVHVPEGRRLFVDMTVEENLDMGALRGRAREERDRTKDMVFELFPILKERRRQPAGTLSGGEQQMLAIGRGLMAKPRLLMLDEPSLGLAPILVKGIFDVIKRVREEGVTILVVEQNVKQSLMISDRAYVLENGRIVLQGKGQELLDNKHVKTAYLGV